MKKKNIKASKIICLRMLLVTFCLLCLLPQIQANYSLWAVDIEPNANEANRQIKGVVTDINGDPIIGASVFVKGTSVGTTTDISGKFTLTIFERTTLVISYIGYQTEELNLDNNNDDFSITLKENQKELDEIVVIGYGTQKKVNLTGSVGTVNTKVFESVPVQNAVQALQGHIPGLNIHQTTGTLNARASIDVRGLATIGEGSSGGALVLIDGMEGDIYSINSQDIESISILKDAAASSIYGSRAPFGVILITTKKGKEGKTIVNYNNSFRFNKPINMPQMMDSYTWATYFNEAQSNAGWGLWVQPERLQRIKDYIDGKISTSTVPNGWNTSVWGDGYEWGNDNIDYYDVIYKDITTAQEHNVSISGGQQNMSYYLSAGYLGQDGFLDRGKDNANRYNLSGSINSRLFNILDVNYTMRYIRNEYRRPTHMTDNFFNAIGYQSWPVKPLYDPNGILFDDHILHLEGGGKHKMQNTSISQQIQFVLEPVKGWRVLGDLNYRYDTEFTHEDQQTVHQTAVDGVTWANIWNLATKVQEYAHNVDYFNVNVYSDYTKTFANNHNFKILAGFQTEHNNFRDLLGSKQGIMSPEVPTINTTSGLGSNGMPVPPIVSGGYSSWATVGFFGRLNYDYKGKYLLEANLRYDGTSRFRKDNRWGFFPSFSTGWNIARESFFEPISSTVSMLKIRASYGTLGNQNTTSLYPTYITMPYATSSGAWLINNARPNVSWGPGLISSSLTWEKIESWNIGVDFGIFDNRLSGSFDYFVRNTKDMVGPADELPFILGTNVPNTNNTDLRTSGFELELMWRDRLKNGLNYSARFVLSDSQSEITRYSNPSQTLSKYYKGMKWGEIWGYETIGIAKTQEEMDAHLATLPQGGQDALGLQWTAGDIMYKDVDGDGKIDWGSASVSNHGDIKVIGNSTPRFNFGLDLAADWKGFDARVFLQGVMKRDFFQGSHYFWGADNRSVWLSMGLKPHQDYFRNDPNHHLGLNLDSYYPRPLWGTAKNQQVQNKYLQDASYIRLKNLQIGYTLPSSTMKKIGVNKLRLFISGENLLTFTSTIKLFDPETISANSGNAYPLSRVYSFGLNVTF